mmetsp:Transcript_49893/g.139639  ORF Transcript_49893/g.139639 Transcript_49893/m.139639 type:complete len:246 (+) Transcript_49893:240-977(+)
MQGARGRMSALSDATISRQPRCRLLQDGGRRDVIMPLRGLRDLGHCRLHLNHCGLDHFSHLHPRAPIPRFRSFGFRHVLRLANVPVVVVAAGCPERLVFRNCRLSCFRCGTIRRARATRSPPGANIAEACDLIRQVMRGVGTHDAGQVELQALRCRGAAPRRQRLHPQGAQWGPNRGGCRRRRGRRCRGRRGRRLRRRGGDVARATAWALAAQTIAAVAASVCIFAPFDSGASARGLVADGGSTK